MKLTVLIAASMLLATPVLAHPHGGDHFQMERPAHMDRARADRSSADRPTADHSTADRSGARQSRDAAPAHTDHAATTGGSAQHDSHCKKGDCTAPADHSEDK